MIFFTKGAVTSSEHLYWKVASTAGKGMPSPPRRVGRAKIFLSNADMDFLPIRACRDEGGGNGFLKGLQHIGDVLDSSEKIGPFAG